MPTLSKPSDLQADYAGGIAPAVIYAAKSTDDPRGSIATQIANCQVLCKRDGLIVEATYTDEAKSAYHASRGRGLAQAREHAETLAAEHGSCALAVQHTDRLALGDGIVAEHLVGLLLWARRVGVCIRSVEDDSTGENLLMAASATTRTASERPLRPQRAGDARRSAANGVGRCPTAT